MKAITSYQVAHELTALGSDCGPGEFHGMVLARAALFGVSETAVSRAAVKDWLQTETLSDALYQVTARLYTQALESLDEFADFDLTLLLPADDAPMDERFSELTCWCNGFLFGLGLGLGSNDWLNDPDFKEMLSDLSQIGQSLVPVPDSEDNEGDYFEIIEYIRVVVLSIATEAQRSRKRLR